MKSHMALVVALGVAAMLAGCASSGPARTAQVAANDGERICRDVLTPGSNVKRTYCATEDEWREYERAQRRGSSEFMRRMSQSSSVVVGGN